MLIQTIFVFGNYLQKLKKKIVNIALFFNDFSNFTFLLQVIYTVLFSFFGLLTLLFGFLATYTDPTDPYYYEEMAAYKNQ